MHHAFQSHLKRICLIVLIALAALIPKTLAYAADPSDTALALPKVTAKAGDTLDLDLTLTGNPGIMGMTVEVNYDSRLTLTNIKNGEAFKALEMTKPGVLESGCRIHWDAVELTGTGIKDGVIATLTFTVSETAPAGASCFVRVAGVSENGQMDVYDTELHTVDLKAASGSVSIKSEEQPEPVRVTGITLDQNTLSFTGAGQTHQLQAHVVPENADDTTVLWSSSDQAVAQVDTNGFVTTIADGTADITATTRDGGYSATCTITVATPQSTVPVTGVELDKASFNMSEMGEQVQLQATVEPPNASDPSVRWASSDPSVATVSDDGLVTAVSEGVTTIMVSTVDGGYLKACVVTVAIPLPVVSILDTEVTITPQFCTYTGEALTPSVVVKHDNKELVDEIDYSVLYENNVDAGRAYVTVTGRGRFMSERVLTFDIVPQPINDLEITLSESQPYTGEAVEPAVTVMHNDKALVAGTDYTVSYSNNVEPGTATVKVEGKGNYSGSAEATFTIAATSLAKAKVTVASPQYATGAALKPAPVVVLNGKTLKAETDYTVAYKNNVKPGTATVTVTGKGCYSGSASATFKIVDRWQRLSGANAVATMQAIVQSDGVFTPSSVSTVIVAGRRDFKAALAGTGLAGLYKAPLLITEPGKLSGPTKVELQRLKPSRVIVCGDTSVVSKAAYNAIKSAVPKAKVSRVSGATHSATAVAIAKSRKGWGKTCVVATQASFKDALSIAPYSYWAHAPIFFTESKRIKDGKGLSSATLAQIKAGRFSRVLIVGGNLAVPKSVESQLKGIKCQRLAGANAIETSRIIGQFELKEGMNRKHLAVATTKDFADALSGASLAGAQGSVLVLANQTGGYGAFNAIYSRNEVEHGHVLGGPLALSNASESYFRKK